MASAIHAACARHSDAHGGLTRAAVQDVLQELGEKQGNPSAFTKRLGCKTDLRRQRSLAAVVEDCGVPWLSEQRVGRRAAGEAHSFCVAHIIFVVWSRVVEAMDARESEETPVVTFAKDLVVSAIAVENRDGGECVDMPVDIGDLVERIGMLTECALGAPLDTEHLRKHVATVMPAFFTPSLFAAQTWLMSNATSALVGPTCASVLRRQSFHEALGRPPPEDDVHAVQKSLVAEVMALRREAELRREGLFDDEIAMRPSKRSRTSAAIDHTLRTKTLTIELCAANKVAFRNAPRTIAQATGILNALAASGGDEQTRVDAKVVEEHIVGHTQLARHALVVADGLHCLLRDRLAAARDKAVFGVGFCSDESPPRGRRFTGYRFQITWLFVPMFPAVADWESAAYDAKAPVTVEQFLLDVVHCPSKDGATVLATIEKQIGRVGLSRADVCSGTGDGGGENEGVTGVHAELERAGEGYVRRRCLGHIAWRAAEASFPAMASVRNGMKAAARYFHEGGAWERLKIIAVAPVGVGGVQLFQQGSREYVSVFGRAPPSILDGRPETDSHFAEWLVPRCGVLSTLVDVDRHQRPLTGEDGETTRLSFASQDFRVRLAIAAEVLRRGLFLHRWANAHARVAEVTSLDALVAKAVHTLTDPTTVDDEFLVVRRLSRAALAARGWAGKSWVEVAVLHCFGGDARRCEDVLPESYTYHTSISSAAAAHLQLVFQNIFRTSWIAGAMLSKDAVQAQHAARQIHQKLVGIDAASMTAFERAFVADGRMELLASFAKRDPPVLLWRDGGRYEGLYRWLAVRFLSNPDNVLQCESIHAQWQWIETCARSIKLKQLNAVLQIRAWIQTFGELPAVADLQPYLDEITADVRRRYQLVRAGGEIAPGFCEDHLYQDRFNLARGDAMALGARREARPTPATAATAFMNYFRLVFDTNCFYNVEGLHPSLYFFVLERKVLAGREQEWNDEDAVGRVLSVAFFEATDESDAFAPVVTRCNRESPSLEVVAVTLAEIIRAMGFHVPVAAGSTAREHEEAMMQGWLTHEPQIWNHERLVGHDDIWAHVLSDRQPAERRYLTDTHPYELTKMGCARYLEIFHGEDREDLWRRLDKTALEVACGAPVGRGGRGRGRGRAAAAGAPAAVAVAGGPVPVAPRGRGRGHRGRRGRGRGP